MTKSKQKDTIPLWAWMLLVIFIIAIIVIYIVSLGNVNIVNESKILSDFKDTKEEALKKHAELQTELEKLQALKLKLDRYFKAVYLFVRIGLVCGSATIVYLIGQYSGAETIGDFLNYYEASIIILLGLNFIAFGTMANSKEFIKLVKTNVENFVWRKNLTLINRIKLFQKDLASIAQTINGTAIPISTFGTQRLSNTSVSALVVEAMQE